MRITIHSFIALPLTHYDCELWSFTTQEGGFPCGSVVKESACSAGDLSSIPESRRSFGGGHGNPLQYSYLENPMDRGTWWAAVCGVTKQSDVTKATEQKLNTQEEEWVLFRMLY